MERLSSSTQINTELEEKMVDLDLVQQRLEVNVNFLEESNRELKFERQTLNMKIYDLTDEVSAEHVMCLLYSFIYIFVILFKTSNTFNILLNI